MTKLPDVFLWDGSEVFATSSSYAREGNVQLGTCAYLDLTSPGRQEVVPPPLGESIKALTWCPRQDSNLCSRLRRPVKPRSCLSLAPSHSVFPAQRVMSGCGLVWFIARILARTTIFAG